MPPPPSPATNAESSAQLSLDNVRQTLLRLEETLIFGFIERAQFCHNAVVYRVGAFPELAPEASLCGYLLHETERTHALMRRYTSPDEHPFYHDLPPPRLAPLRYAENPLAPNTVNFNARILNDYTSVIIPRLCPPGDDRQYGSSVVCDIPLLQAASRRIHYGKFVAESKYRQTPAAFDPLIAAGDTDGLFAAITHVDVEQQVIARVAEKSTTFLSALRRQGASRIPSVSCLTDIYREWIIPLNKAVQVEYLLARAPLPRQPPQRRGQNPAVTEDFQFRGRVDPAADPDAVLTPIRFGGAQIQLHSRR